MWQVNAFVATLFDLFTNYFTCVYGRTVHNQILSFHFRKLVHLSNNVFDEIDIIIG